MQLSSGPASRACARRRVLSDFYDRVTVFERDDLPERPANRSAVPQGRHVHLLMARGAQEFDALFPGLLDDMVAAGVPILENRPDSHPLRCGRARPGHTPPSCEDEFTTYVPSRPHLEWQIRRRTAWLPNVEIKQRSVSAPRFDAVTQRVTGVELDERGMRRSRSRRRRDRPRHPTASVVGRVGI